MYSHYPNVRYEAISKVDTQINSVINFLNQFLALQKTVESYLLLQALLSTQDGSSNKNEIENRKQKFKKQ